MEDVFNDNQSDINPKREQSERPRVLKSEVSHAIQQVRYKKAVAPDQIPAEVLKLTSEEILKNSKTF